VLASLGLTIAGSVVSGFVGLWVPVVRDLGRLPGVSGGLAGLSGVSGGWLLGAVLVCNGVLYCT
jgi:hypothetical protein